MAGTQPRSAREPAAGQVDAGSWAQRRSLYLDNLKVVLVAAVIVGHALGSYTSTEMFAYADVRETTLAPATEAALIAMIAPVGLFMIPLLFLIAGLLTPRSLERKGPAAFARDRLWRLGVPFAIYSFLLRPALLFTPYRPLGNASGSYWRELVGSREEALDTGYLWFVGDLLLFSLVYAACMPRVCRVRGFAAALRDARTPLLPRSASPTWSSSPPSSRRPRSRCGSSSPSTARSTST